MALTAEGIVRAASGILDAYGLADLTMRRVADALGVKAGALYWHFPNKQTLLAAVADDILTDSAADAPGHDLTLWATDTRAHLLAHRDAAELVASTRAMGLGRVDPSHSASALLRAQGMRVDEADAVAATFMHFLLGHVMEEQTRSQLAALGVVGSFDEKEADRRFASGVELLVAGVRALSGPYAQV